MQRQRNKEIGQVGRSRPVRTRKRQTSTKAHCKLLLVSKSKVWHRVPEWWEKAQDQTGCESRQCEVGAPAFHLCYWTMMAAGLALNWFKLIHVWLWSWIANLCCIPRGRVLYLGPVGRSVGRQPHHSFFSFDSSSAFFLPLLFLPSYPQTVHPVIPSPFLLSREICTVYSF